MSERAVNIQPTGNSEPALALSDIVQRLHRNETYYRETDPANITLSVFADAALSALDSMRPFRQNIEDLVALRPDLTPAHAVKLIERCYQAVLLKNDPSYPYAYHEKTAWEDAFSDIEKDSSASEMLYYRLLTQKVQSNIAERYKTVKLLAGIYRDRFGDAPNHLDVGSSVLHGDIKLVYNRTGDPPRVPFSDMLLHEPLSDKALEQISTGEKQARHRSLTDLANTALQQTVQFGEVIGVDITDVDDPAIKEWAKSCSFYPDELCDSQKVAEYDELDRLDPAHERVRFAKVDFSNTSDVRKLRGIMDGKKFDIITFSTIFYQVDFHERHAMLVNAAQLLSDGGIILIQDAPDGNFETQYRYGAALIDSTRPELGEQQVLRWKTPRCNEAMVGLGRLSVRGKLLRFDQALEQSINTA